MGVIGKIIPVSFEELRNRAKDSDEFEEKARGLLELASQRDDGMTALSVGLMSTLAMLAGSEDSQLSSQALDIFKRDFQMSEEEFEPMIEVMKNLYTVYAEE